MAARSLASGTISFGLGSVPVKFYTAAPSKSVSFNLLHAKDHTRLCQRYRCNGCNEVVARGAMVKGVEYAKDPYAIHIGLDLEAVEEQNAN